MNEYEETLKEEIEFLKRENFALLELSRRAEVLLSELYTRNEMALTQFEEAKKKLNATVNE